MVCAVTIDFWPLLESARSSEAPGESTGRGVHEPHPLTVGVSRDTSKWLYRNPPALKVCSIMTFQASGNRCLIAIPDGGASLPDFIRIKTISFKRLT